MRKFKLFVLLLGIFSFLGLNNVKATPEVADVKVTYYLDGNVAVAEASVPSINVGDLVSLPKPAAVSGTFAFWTVNGAVRKDLPETLSIKASSKLILKAYYVSSGTKVGVFLDSNLQYIEAKYTTGSTVVPPTDLPDKPFATNMGWCLIDNYDVSVSNFTLTEDKTFFVIKYSSNHETATITFEGSDYVKNIGDVIILNAPGEFTNPVWKANGKIMGYGTPLAFTVLGNLTVTVEDSSTPVTDYVVFRGPIALRTGHNSYVGSFDVGTKQVVDFGFILDNLTKLPSSSYNAETKEFLKSITNTTTRYPIGTYVTYMDGTNPVTIMSPEVYTVAEELLYSYNFLDGGDNNNNFYTNTDLTTNVSYAEDNPGGTVGTTEWKADYANLSMSTETRVGGKLVSTEYGLPNANIRTNFSYDKIITKVEVLGAKTFGTASNVGDIYLQQSTDSGVTWTTIATHVGGLSSTPITVSFDGLKLSEGSRIKLVVEVTASTDNSGLAFTGIKVYGLTAINHAKKDIDAITFAQTTYNTATTIPLPTTGSVYGSTIGWVSSNTDVISNTGEITLPATTTEVTMTATATKGTQTFSKAFVFTVIGSTPLPDYTITLFAGTASGTQNFNNYFTGPTTSSYATVTDVEDGYGVWSGKSSLDSTKGLGQRFKDSSYLTYTAEAGYYIYSIQIDGNTNSTNEKTISFAGVVILTSNTTALATGEIVILTGNITTGTFATDTGTSYISKIVIVCKPLP